MIQRVTSYLVFVSSIAQSRMYLYKASIRHVYPVPKCKNEALEHFPALSMSCGCIFRVTGLVHYQLNNSSSLGIPSEQYISVITCTSTGVSKRHPLGRDKDYDMILKDFMILRFECLRRKFRLKPSVGIQHFQHI